MSPYGPTSVTVAAAPPCLSSHFLRYNEMLEKVLQPANEMEILCRIRVPKKVNGISMLRPLSPKFRYRNRVNTRGVDIK